MQARSTMARKRDLILVLDSGYLRLRTAFSQILPLVVLEALDAASSRRTKDESRAHGATRSAKTHLYSYASARPPATATLVSSASDSKLRPKRARRLGGLSQFFSFAWSPPAPASRKKHARLNAYDKLVLVAFLGCLVLFLRALSGSGMHPEPESGGGGGAHAHARARASPHIAAAGNGGHVSALRRRLHASHLSVDPEGHFSYSFAPDDAHGYTWGWGRPAYAQATGLANTKDGPAEAGKEAGGVPGPAADETAVPPKTDEARAGLDDATSVPPPPVALAPTPAPFVSSLVLEPDAGFSIAERGETTGASGNRDSGLVDPLQLELPVFGLSDPVYPLRIHLPSDPVIPDGRAHRRRRRMAHDV
ncbi:hypothetical protein DFH11DRAFT_1544803 [Phellopilus nigrolimitatus]|nr:hypothetical protein DFH11DRAFT_1544803 [Phellopilus nigrolimitatus]